jgi:hypothetical protein
LNLPDLQVPHIHWMQEAWRLSYRVLHEVFVRHRGMRLASVLVQGLPNVE